MGDNLYSRKRVIDSIKNNLIDFQIQTAFDILKIEDETPLNIATDNTSFDIVSRKYGVLKTIRGSGKTRTIVATCKASFGDSIDEADKIKRGKAVSRDMIREYQPPILDMYYTRTNLVVLPPMLIPNWEKEMRLLNVKFIKLKKKDDFKEINISKAPVIALLSSFNYSDFLRNNRDTIWNRVIIETNLSPEYYYMSANLKFIFSWALLSDNDAFHISFQNYIINSAFDFETFIGNSNQEEYMKTKFIAVNKTYKFFNDNSDFYLRSGLLSDQKNTIEYINDHKANNSFEETRIKTVSENIMNISNENCSICFDEFKLPVLFKCCLNIVCANCVSSHIISTTRNDNYFNCIMCRSQISLRNRTICIDIPIIAQISPYKSKKATVIDVISKVLLKKTLLLHDASNNDNLPDPKIYDIPKGVNDIVKMKKKLSKEHHYFIKGNIIDILIANRTGIFDNITDIIDIRIKPSDTDEINRLKDIFLKLSRNSEIPLTIHTFETS